MLGVLFQALPVSAQEPQPQEAPRLELPETRPPVINGHGTGFIPPMMDLSHLKAPTCAQLEQLSQLGQSGMEGVMRQSVSQPPPSSFDWRTQGVVSPVKDQGSCGSCYAFAAIANIESATRKVGTGMWDFSEDNAKECNWYHASCSGGNYGLIISEQATTGLVCESCDPYHASYVNCDPSCPPQITPLGWAQICTNSVPSADLLKCIIYNYGPVYTAMYAGSGDSWAMEFGSYTGLYTLYYGGTEAPNHAVLIVGWDDSLIPEGHPESPGGWIVKNSWGNTTWGGPCGYGTEKGYFTIGYGSANIGQWTSFMVGCQLYDPNGDIWYYDEGGWTSSYGWGDYTGWGLCKFTATSNTNVTRIEFWTTDSPTEVDVYIYGGFDGTNLSSLLASKTDIQKIYASGYHSVALDSPVAVTNGQTVVAVVKFTNNTYSYPIPIDVRGTNETERCYASHTGATGTWTDLGVSNKYSVAIRLRTSTNPPAEMGQKLIGPNVAAGNAGALGNYIRWNKWTATQSGTVTSFRVKAAADGYVKVAIYADSGGNPGALLNATNCGQPVTAGCWNPMSIPATTIIQGNNYWLTTNYDNPGAIEYRSSGGAMRYKSATYSGFTFSDPAGGGLSPYGGYQLVEGWGMARQKLIGADDAPGYNAGTCLRFSKFTADQTGHIARFSVKSGAAANVKAAIYADSAGNPGALLGANNNSQAVTPGWNSLNIPTTCIVAGKDYWLATVYDTTGGVQYRSGGTMRYKSAGTYATFTFADPAGSGLSPYAGHELVAGWGVGTTQLIGSAATSGSNGGKNWLRFSKFTAGTAGAVTHIVVLSGVTGRVKAAIYADDNGKPGALLAANSAGQAVTPGYNAICICLVNIVAGTDYWISTVYDTTGAVKYRAGPSPTLRYKSATYAGFTFPDPAGSGFSSFNGYEVVGGWGVAP